MSRILPTRTNANSENTLKLEILDLIVWIVNSGCCNNCWIKWRFEKGNQKK